MAKNVESKPWHVVAYDSNPTTDLLEAVNEGVERSGWALDAYYRIYLAKPRLEEATTRALIATLGVRALDSEVFPAEELFEVSDRLNIPRMIISQSPEADMFIRDEGDLLIPDNKLEVVSDEVTRWLGNLTQRYMQSIE